MADLIDLILRSKLAQWTMSVLEGMTPGQAVLFAMVLVGITCCLIAMVEALIIRVYEIARESAIADEVEREGVFID